MTESYIELFHLPKAGEEWDAQTRHHAHAHAHGDGKHKHKNHHHGGHSSTGQGSFSISVPTTAATAASGASGLQCINKEEDKDKDKNMLPGSQSVVYILLSWAFAQTEAFVDVLMSHIKHATKEHTVQVRLVYSNSKSKIAIQGLFLYTVGIFCHVECCICNIIA